MALYPCARCGRTDDRRMVALMSRWFAELAELEPDHGYFYLCPPCYDRRVEPRVRELRRKALGWEEDPEADGATHARGREDAAEPPGIGAEEEGVAEPHARP